MKTMDKTRLVLIFACALCMNFLTGCPKAKTAYCNNDSECSMDGALGAGVCISGQCKDCNTDSDCTQGAKCNLHRCELPCGDSGSCAAGYHCEAGFCSIDCKGDEDCDFNSVCENSRCVVPPTMCSEDTDCESGFFCVSGMCSNQTMSKSSMSEVCAATNVLHFDFDQSVVTSGDSAVLDGEAKCLKGDANRKLRLEGHADSRGTTEYNLALGQRRADSVMQYLSKVGVDSSRLNTVSYGKERPALSEENEGAWAQNRRVEIKVVE